MTSELLFRSRGHKYAAIVAEAQRSSVLIDYPHHHFTDQLKNQLSYAEISFTLNYGKVKGATYERTIVFK